MEKQIRIVKKVQDEGNLLYWLSLTVKERMAELEGTEVKFSSLQRDKQNSKSI